jgi:adenylate cyclase
MMVSFSLVRRFEGELPEEIRSLWTDLLRTQMYVVGATGVVSVVMALLVARFINRPVQALRAAMERVADGDLDVGVPVRSTDELGELNEHFNVMVADLRQAERTRELLGRYVSPAVARQALERGLALGGELTNATAMFVDLRGFTALTERNPPARVVDILNEYYGLVERVCEREGGIVAQFLGDGVVVVFGGPLRPFPDHARRAVRAAIALQRALKARNAAVGEPLQAGIGICTGDIIAGNIGAGGRVTYTIVGDAVNQAARLQVKTRDLGASILVTESTREALGGPDGFVLEPRGAVGLKGIAAPVEVYAVAG